jgi:hypothetical protein
MARSARMIRPAFLLFASLLIMGPEVHAWRHACVDNEYGTNICFHQPGSCVSWSINKNGSDDVEDLDAVRGALQRAFGAWNANGCSYIKFYETPVSSCGCKHIGYSSEGGNVNLIVWCEEYWSSDYPQGAVALTFVHYEEATGEIVDTDVAFNGATFTFGLVDDPENCDEITDIQNTMTHEAGHMLGFDESDVEGSTMWPYTFECDMEKRTLGEDDIAGLCVLYPVDIDPQICNSPVGGLEECDGCGCEVTPGADRFGGASFLIAALLGCAVLAGRRKRIFSAR